MSPPKEYLSQIIGLLVGVIVILIAFVAKDPRYQNVLISVGASILASSLMSIFLLTTVGDPFGKIEQRLSQSVEEFRSSLLATSRIVADAERSGLTGVSASRSNISTEEWISRLGRCRTRVMIIAYAMDFLTEHDRFLEILADKLVLGCKVRILLVEPEGFFVGNRNIEEANEGSIRNRVETSIARLGPLVGKPGFQLALYDAPLYCSIFAFDDEMIVTPHLYGVRGARAPVMIIREVKGGLYSRYAQHFEDIWRSAKVYNNAAGG